jgi:hypothetical protein
MRSLCNHDVWSHVTSITTPGVVAGADLSSSFCPVPCWLHLNGCSSLEQTNALDARSPRGPQEQLPEPTSSGARHQCWLTQWSDPGEWLLKGPTHWSGPDPWLWTSPPVQSPSSQLLHPGKSHLAAVQQTPASRPCNSAVAAEHVRIRVGQMMHPACPQ